MMVEPLMPKIPLRGRIGMFLTRIGMWVMGDRIRSEYVFAFASQVIDSLMIYMNQDTSNRVLLTDIFKMVGAHFRDEPIKAVMWFVEENPQLGNVTPVNMLTRGRIFELHRIVKSLIEGNLP